MILDLARNKKIPKKANLAIIIYDGAYGPK